MPKIFQYTIRAVHHVRNEENTQTTILSQSIEIPITLLRAGINHIAKTLDTFKRISYIFTTIFTKKQFNKQM